MLVPPQLHPILRGPTHRSQAWWVPTYPALVSIQLAQYPSACSVTPSVAVKDLVPVRVHIEEYETHVSISVMCGCVHVCVGYGLYVA